MFESYFGLERTPFRKDLAPADLYPSLTHKEALARLTYAAGKRAIAVLTGEIGAGKTMTIRALHDRLDPAHYKLIYLAEAKLSPRTFYRTLGHKLGLEPSHYASDAKQQVQEAILTLYRDQRMTPVTVIDEAHLLGKDMMEEIRFLVNFQMDSAAPMALILAGQPELQRTLGLRAFEAVNQRVELRMHLTGLTLEEMRGYVQHHIKVAGGVRELFTSAAIKVIYEHARGVPRRVNNICNNCLLLAFSKEETIIDDELVRQVLATEYALPN